MVVFETCQTLPNCSAHAAARTCTPKAWRRQMLLLLLLRTGRKEGEGERREGEREKGGKERGVKCRWPR